MNLSEKDKKTLQTVSLVSGLFTLLVALIMLMGYVQLQRVKPLENPALVQLKEQFVQDQENKDLQEQIRALDLLSRKVFFSSTWQVQIGSYLLLAGAIIFILAQRLLTANDKTIPAFPGDPGDEKTVLSIKRQWLLIPAVLLFMGALAVSLTMRRNLPNPSKVLAVEEIQNVSVVVPGGQSADGSERRAQSSGSESQGTGTGSEQGAQGTEQAAQGTGTGAEQVAQGSGTGAERRAQGAEQVAQGAGQVTPLSPGQTFPAFRGPGSRGYAEGTGYPTEWDGATGKGVIWKVKIPKPGYNSPVIWGNKLFITGADESGEEIYCYSVADGKLLWQASPRNIAGAPASPPETAEDTGLAAPTAAVNGDYVIAIFATGNLVCTDHNGKIIWTKNIGHPDNHYGHSSSLLIYKDIVVVQFDHNIKATIMAFNIRTGDKAWETARTGSKISWASPVIAPFNGKDQVILTSDPYVAGYDLTNGKELWRTKGVSAEIGPSVGVNSTMVFAGNEFAKLIGLVPGAGNEPLWEDNEFLPEVASPVATEQYVFVATSFGAVACYETKTGKLVWEHYFDYGFYASPIIAEGRVYLMDISGVMKIFKPTGTLELIASSPLGEKSVSTPAFAHGKLFIRGTSHIYCIGKN
jgi:outer membrane protein assembly factor BamB